MRAFIHNLRQVFDIINEDSRIVLFSEEPEYAYIAEYYFLKKGLERNETCIHISLEDDIALIEREMADIGVDIEANKKKHTLLIVNLQRDSDIFDIRKALEATNSRAIPAFRIVSRSTKIIDTRSERQRNIEAERTRHEGFSKYHGPFLCSYHVRNIKLEMKGKWMRSHLKNHDAVIYILRGGETLAFNLPAGRSDFSVKD
jgi:hypothetical protein